MQSVIGNELASQIVSTLLLLWMATFRLVGHDSFYYFTLLEVVCTYYKKNVSLGKKKDRNAHFCSLECNGLADGSCHLHLPSFGEVGYSWLRWTVPLNFANTKVFTAESSV